MSMSSGAVPSRSRKGLGRAGQVVGILGALVFIAAIAGVWIGRGIVADDWTAFTESAGRSLAKVTEVASTATAKLDERAAEVEAIAEEARSIATQPTISSAIVQGIADKLSGVGDRYADLRSQYVDLRDKASSVIDLVQKVDRLIPGIDIPQGPIDALGAVDEGLSTLDAAITGITDGATATTALTEAATTLADDADAIAGGLRQGSAAITGLSGGIGTFAGQIKDAGDQVLSLLGTIAIVISLVLAWGAFLHLCLFALGRRLARGG